VAATNGIASVHDFYKNFKFLVKWDGRYVAGVSKVGPLSRSTEVIEHRVGGDISTVRKAPGLSQFEAVTLERGVSHDFEFTRWANKVWYLQAKAGSEASLADFRKNIIIEIYNEAGQKATAYNLFNCWVSEFHAMSDLDANGNALLFESITLQNEGWLRDYDYQTPSPPEYTIPAVS
jgi:phage tail-like protein